MNWAAWAPAIITVVAAIFTAGKTVGRISDQEIAIKRHEDWLGTHDDKFMVIDGEIGGLKVQAGESKAWRDGYAAGKASHGRQIS